MSDGTIFVAKDSVLGEFEGRPLYIHQGVTTVRAGHPLLSAFGDLFVPLRPTFEVEPEPEAMPEPDPKDVRAWAKERGIEVPSRGALPAEVVEQYQAAQGA